MGSVQSKIECPNCSSEECIEDFYYKTDEEYIFCPDCGYIQEFFYKKDKDGKFELLDKTKGFAFDNLVPVNRSVEHPFGSFRIEATNSFTSMGSLETNESYEEFVSNIVSQTNQPNDFESVVVSRFVDGKIIKENIYERVKQS